MLEAMDMIVTEIAATVVARSSSGIVVHTCKCCGKQRDLRAWKRLHLVTRPHAPEGRASGLEFRNCDGAGCGSTLALDVEVVDGR